MTEQRDEEQVIRAWHDHRPYLVGLAFHMLGDPAAIAEDVVQEAFSRLVRAWRRGHR